jgi:elongator complex protein 2
VFDAPVTFIQTLSNISQLSLKIEEEERPLGANVPPLGLSNKALYKGKHDVIYLYIDTALGEKPEEHKETEYEIPPPLPIVHTTPPVEEYLLQSTLWPETHKL